MVAPIMSTDVLDAIAKKWLTGLRDGLQGTSAWRATTPRLSDALREKVHGAVFYALMPEDVIPDSIR